MVTLDIKVESIICPQCDERSIAVLEIEDPEFGKRNKLAPAQTVDIAEDGQFQIYACMACGFKFMKNEGRASSSQLALYLLTHYVEQVVSATATELGEMIAELDLVGIDVSSIKGKGYTAITKLTILDILNKHLSTCALDDLVELYNSVACYEEYEEATNTNIEVHGLPGTPVGTPGVQFKTAEVLADD
jgi:hypothetical protein